MVADCQLPTELIIVTTQRAHNDKVTSMSAALHFLVCRREPTVLEVMQGNASLSIFERNKQTQLSSFQDVN